MPTSAEQHPNTHRAGELVAPLVHPETAPSDSSLTPSEIPKGQLGIIIPFPEQFVPIEWPELDPKISQDRFFENNRSGAVNPQGQKAELFRTVFASVKNNVEERQPPLPVFKDLEAQYTRSEYYFKKTNTTELDKPQILETIWNELAKLAHPAVQVWNELAQVNAERYARNTPETKTRTISHERLYELQQDLVYAFAGDRLVDLSQERLKAIRSQHRRDIATKIARHTVDIATDRPLS